MKIEKHPDADKLVVCQVDVGAEELLQIVTGAPNVKRRRFGSYGSGWWKKLPADMMAESFHRMVSGLKKENFAACHRMV